MDQIDSELIGAKPTRRAIISKPRELISHIGAETGPNSSGGAVGMTHNGRKLMPMAPRVNDEGLRISKLLRKDVVVPCEEGFFRQLTVPATGAALSGFTGRKSAWVSAQSFDLKPINKYKAANLLERLECGEEGGILSVLAVKWKPDVGRTFNA